MHDIAEIKKKSVTGIVALTTRTFLLQIITFTATFILTVLLTPQVFGVYYVVSAIIAFLTYFSDIGLAAAIIQKKDEVSDDDLAVTFTIQQILVVTVILLSLGFSGLITNFYGLPESGLRLFRALVISFLLSSLKTIPSVIMERKLEFNKLVIPQITETCGFYLVAVFMAWRGYGISSFTYAVLVRAVLGLVTIYILCPWKPRFIYKPETALSLMKFGLPFQINSILALLKDDLLTVYLGKTLPFAQIGYIGWAKKWAEVPLRLILDSIVKVTFPAFSRIQHSKELLGKAIETTLFGVTTAIFPVTSVMIFFGHPLISIIPRYAKWEPAFVSFVIFALASAISSMSVPLTNILNAVGRIKTTLKFMILWTAGTWILTISAIKFLGFQGVSVSALILTMTIILVIIKAKQSAPFSFFKATYPSFIGFIIQSTLYILSLRLLPNVNLISIMIIGVCGLFLYSWIVLKIRRDLIYDIIQTIKAKKI